MSRIGILRPPWAAIRVIVVFTEVLSQSHWPDVASEEFLSG